MINAQNIILFALDDALLLIVIHKIVNSMVISMSHSLLANRPIIIIWVITGDFILNIRSSYFELNY